MSEQKKIVNIFSGGMRQDFHEGDNDNKSYRFARNAKRTNQDISGFGLSNEESNRLFSTAPGTIVGGGYLKNKNRFVVFTSGGEIGWVKTDHEGNGEYEKIAGGCWDFSNCEYLYFEAKSYGKCNETTLYFSSKGTYYRVPIEESMSPRGAGLSCDDYLLFRCVCGPNMIPKVHESGGGNLQIGAYQFVVQLEDRDGNRTNWFHVSQPVNIGSADNKINDISKEYIQLHLKDLDPRFNKVNIGVIKTNGNLRTIQWVDTIFYNTRGITFDYYGPTGREKDLTETDILNKKTMFFKGHDLIQRDGVLYLYRLLPEKNLDYQRRANNVIITFPKYAVPANEIHKYPTLMRSGRYKFGIVWKYCDGTYSHVFEIPAGGGGGTSFLPRARRPVADDVNDGGGSENPGAPGGSPGESSGDVDVVPFEPVKYELDEIEHEEFMRDIHRIINQFETRLIDTCECLDCASGHCSDDMPDYEEASASYVDFMEDMVKSHEYDGGSADMLEAFKRFVGSFIDEARDKKFKKAKYNHTSPAPSNPLAGASGAAARSRDEEAGEWGDSNAVKVGEASSKVYLSTATYPLTLDCNGDYIYGDLAGQRVRIHEAPSAAEEPFYFSEQEGVPNKYHPDNTEFVGRFVTLGVKAANIEFPNPDELPKPLCPNQPYEIVMAPRDEFNNDIVGKGAAFHCFEGESHGKRMFYPKHAVNSVEYFDKHINDGDGNRRGENSGAGAYVVHSPDTAFRHPALNPYTWENELEIYGTGWRYGLYAEGRPPDSFFEQQLDQRGARQSVNLNNQGPKPGRQRVSGITYAQGNVVVPAPPGASMDLCNMFRESSVFMELGGKLPGLSNTGGACNGGDSDLSFTGDGIDHECPIKAGATHYGLFRRRILNMYGSPVERKYNSIGLIANRPNQTSIEGTVGDSWLGFFNIRRTGYVADKQGDEELHRPDPPYKWIFRFFMMNDKTRLPKTGDLDDPKNLLDLHGGVRCGEVTCTGSESTYYPRVVKTSVTFPCESRVNLHYRQTDDPQLNQIYYPKLKGLALDSEFPSGGEWSDCWLNRFYCEVRRPSKFQQAMSTFLKTGSALAPPAWWIHELIQTDAPMDWDFISWMAGTPGVIGMWLFFVFFMFRTRMLEDLLQIPRPLKDEENGQYEDDNVRQWEDNYYEYNQDFSIYNDMNLYIGLPDPYDTKDCAKICIGNNQYGCCKEGPCIDGVTTNEVIYSNKQNLESPIDAYRNFEANSYFEIDGANGLLMKLFIFNNNFFYQTTDGIGPLYSREESIYSPSELTLGPVSLYKDPSNIAQGITEGLWGNEDPNALEVTPYGVFFVDREARSIYQFLGLGQVEDLASEKYGMSHFLREHLQFCALENNTCYSCVDEKDKRGVYYTMGVDNRNKRLLFTKKDTNGGSFTMSFDMVERKWLSFHDYIPSMYFWDRNHLYSVNGSEIWKHDDNRGSHQKFYGKYYPWEVEFPVVMGQRTPYQVSDLQVYLESQRWDAGASQYVRSRRDFFNRLWFYNSDQSTGLLELYLRLLANQEDSSKMYKGRIEVAHGGRSFRINNLRDYVIDYEQPITRKDSICSPYVVSNQANINYVQKELSKGKNFEDYYHMCRFILDDEKLSDVQMLFRKNELGIRSQTI